MDLLPTVLTSFITTYLASSSKEGPIKSLNNLWYLTMGKFDNYVDLKKEKDIYNLEKEKEKAFAENLATEINNIPEERIQDPRRMIAMPALENARYILDETELKGMFAKLIAKSMDKEFNEITHPSFSNILSQLSPLDAELFNFIYANSVTPVCRYSFEGKGGKGQVPAIENVIIYQNNPVELISASVTNLERLGLIKISYSEHYADDSLYDPLRTHEYIALQRRIIMMKGPASKYEDIEMTKGVLNFTTLGKDFAKICLS